MLADDRTLLWEALKGLLEPEFERYDWSLCKAAPSRNSRVRIVRGPSGGVDDLECELRSFTRRVVARAGRRTHVVVNCLRALEKDPRERQALQLGDHHEFPDGTDFAGVLVEAGGAHLIRPGLSDRKERGINEAVLERAFVAILVEIDAQLLVDAARDLVSILPRPARSGQSRRTGTRMQRRARQDSSAPGPPQPAADSAPW